MRKSMIVCDGCGDSDIAPNDVETPDSFVSCKITVGGWGAGFDLCRHCYTRALEQANPSKWPRIKPAPEATAA